MGKKKGIGVQRAKFISQLGSLKQTVHTIAVLASSQDPCNIFSQRGWRLKSVLLIKD